MTTNLEFLSSLKVASIIVALFAIVGIVGAQHNHTQPRVSSKGMAVMDAQGVFVPFEFDRHAVGDNDVLIEILYCGICHSDIHTVASDWYKANYPMVPGHEIAGRVAKIGKNVKKFKVGDYAGVGCMVNSCGQCQHCNVNEEQYCNGSVYTYDSKDLYHNNEITKGGYSNNIVVSEKFAIKIPPNAPLEKIAPLLCAGITTYSPIQYTNIKKGEKVAVAGFGGLGHMALQYLVARGANVTVFDLTNDKQKEALEMGAEKYINVNNPKELEGLEETFRVILGIIPTKYDPAMYIKMLQKDGEFVVIGAPPIKDTLDINVNPLVLTKRRKVWGVLIGGIKETQEMLDYSIENNIYPRVEIINPSQITEAYKKISNGEVRFRYVIDMSKLK
jgi:uncharacterized zinc-type alcohol dehydrogenase-like protein